LDASGKIEHVYVFCGGSKSTPDMKELFSDIELALFETNKTQITFSNQCIHKDDSVHSMKQKVVFELGINVALEEVYMFGFFSDAVDFPRLFQDITRHTTSTELTQQEFKQLILNLNVSPASLGDVDLTKDSFVYEDLLKLQQTDDVSYVSGKPIGAKFQDHHDFMLSANPFHAKYRVFQESPENQMLVFENTLLLNYGPLDSNNIYVALAATVFEYAEHQGLDEEQIAKLYFPLLYKNGIVEQDALTENRPDMIKDTKKNLGPNTQQYYESIDMFHQIYWGRKIEQPYTRRGITKYSFVLNPASNYLFPLDVIFKTIHATKSTPFIKYNPGKRRENMYRLYAEFISQNGKKIPVLSESTIKRLMREIGKSNQIAIFLQHESKNEVFISFDTNAKMRVSGDLLEPMLLDDFTKFIIAAVNPVIQSMNNVLQSSGYSLGLLNSMTSDLIEDASYKYVATLPIQKKVDLGKQRGSIGNIFDIFESDVVSGAHMRFKRVQNFKEMDAQSALITKMYQSANDDHDILSTLMTNYRMSEEEAIDRLVNYRSEHQELAGKVVENPGFPTLFRMESMTNNLAVEVDEITHLDYIDPLHVYIDTILRISQDKSSTKVSEDKIDGFCKRESKPAPVAEENVISVSTEAPTADVYKIQPLKFGKEEEHVDDDDDEGGIYFDDYDEEAEAEDVSEERDLEEDLEEDARVTGGASEADASEADDNYAVNIDGMSLKKPNPFQRAKDQRDPKLFLTESQGKYHLYSRACPSSDRRQPVILTEEEKARIDKTNPGSYDHAIKYGSDPKKPFYYICPRYWCLKTNMPLTEEQVKSGVCGDVIPQNEKVVPKGAYVYEFANKTEHFDKNGKYIQHHPGFLKQDRHPDGLCIPCCFGKDWNSAQLKKMRSQCAQNEAAEQAAQAPVADGKKGSNYIIKAVSHPLPQNRWGFLPLPVQMFLGMEADKLVVSHNAALIRPDEKILLRYGVEQSERQSFIGCMAYFYAYKHGLPKTPSIQEMREILARSITLDLFLKYHNGSLPAIFRPKSFNQESIDIDKYLEKSAFAKSLNIKDEAQLDFLEETIASYENFLVFLRSDASILDHTYLWDVVIDPNPNIMRDGFNLVIIEVADNDITNNVHMICPTNSYSSSNYVSNKETIVLIKQTTCYEPMHLYEERQGGEILVKKAFMENKSIENIKTMLKLIQNASKKHCAPIPSMPRVYKFKQSSPAIDIIRILRAHNYVVIGQVMNYNNKIIGLRVNTQADQAAVYVPCFPSGLVDGIPLFYMDDPTLWLDYTSTRDRLMGIHNETAGKVVCYPKIKMLEDNLIVGILTETNQFVQIDPPVANDFQDELTNVHHLDYPIKNKSGIDKTMATSKSQDPVRIEAMRKISLESQFYSVFRNAVRLAFNEYTNIARRKQILETLDNGSIFYKDKLSKITSILKDLMRDKLSFQIFDPVVLNQFDEILTCNQTDEEGKCKPYCLTVESGGCRPLFPKTNLMSGQNNETTYYVRVADELIRYRRIRLFMLNPKTYLNISSVEYKILPTELFMLESILVNYFVGLVPYNMNSLVANIHYDNAKPELSAKYSNEISLKAQGELIDATSTESNRLDEYILDCMKETRTVIGNDKMGSWKIVFPASAKEIIFGESIVCSYIPMIYVLQHVLNTKSITIQNVKTTLWNGYSQLMAEYRDKMILLLRRQGKRELMDLITTNKSTFEHVVFSDAYYITDLDWWILSRVANLPVVLFSSTTLKYLVHNVNWLKLNANVVSESSHKKYYFVRSPLNVGINTPPGYNVVAAPYSFSELRSEMFLHAERGDPKFADNIQPLTRFLSSYHVIQRPNR
jgi:hypothetical protein